MPVRSIGELRTPLARIPWRPMLLALVPVALSLSVHRGVLGRFFRGDDLVHMLKLVDRGLLETLLIPHGGHLIVTYVAVLHALFSAFGLDPRPYFALALVVHLLNVSLLFRVVRSLTCSDALALFSAALWGMNPVAQGAVGDFAVFGQLLVTAFVLWILGDVARIARSGRSPTRATQVRWTVLLIASALSFGTGLAIATAFALPLFFLLPDSAENRRAVFHCALLMIVVPALYSGQIWLHEAVSGRIAPTAGLAGGLSTVLLDSLGLESIPAFLKLVAYGTGSLTLGPLVAGLDTIAAGPLAGGSVALASHYASIAAAVVAVPIAFVLARGAQRRRRVLVGLLLLIALDYAPIALARHIIIRPHIPRYHYFAAALVAAAIAVALSEIAERSQALRRVGVALLAFWLLASAGAYVDAGRRTDALAGRDLRARTRNARARIESAIAHSGARETVYIRNARMGFGPFVPRTAFPGLAGYFAILYPENTVRGKRVYFREPSKKVRRAFRSRPNSRIAKLLLAPGELAPPSSGRSASGETGTRRFDASGGQGKHLAWSQPRNRQRSIRTEKTAPTPNIVLVSLDTLRADHVGCYGYARSTTPHIDEMAAEGIRFETAISTSVWTLPAHASMFTGLVPGRHGSVGGGFRASALRSDLQTLAERLRDHGYHTAAFAEGGYVSRSFGFGRGFEHFTETGSGDFAGAIRISFDAAMRWMAERAVAPFFVFLHTYEVHFPYQPPKELARTFSPDYRGPYQTGISVRAFRRAKRKKRLDRLPVAQLEALYDAEILHADEWVGRLIAFLRYRGLHRQTCLVVTSDHGEEFMDHGALLHDRAYPFEELLRVPLIFWCPSRFAGGRVVEDPVSLVDLFPTLLELAGAPAVRSIDGMSLLPALRGEDLPGNRLTVSDVDLSLERGGGRARQGFVLAVRGSRFKLVHSSSDGSRRLFDLDADPLETTDVAAFHPEAMARLSPLLEEAVEQRLGNRDAPNPAAPLDEQRRQQLEALGYVD